MKRLLLPALLSLSLVSCKGPKGDRGDSGNANVKSYSGFVTSNDQLIFVNGGPNDYAIAVSIGDGNNFTNLPYYSNISGNDIYYAFRLNTVELLNADTVPGVQYKIFLVARNGSAASGYRALFN